ncbi:MAG: Mll4877 protein [uncultured Paraburkholderia sp.]|nr:MAG: Mll4877 protein [uncultured Paraburkholderia sp.]CAH2911862.1 MAG: Mll4877 protein [uncultured Paraburkholderia sp.]
MTNPFAGRYEAKIEHAMEALKPIGFDMAQRLLAAIDVPHASIESYGKGAIVGSRGELEHGALWHVPGGHAMRELLEKNGVPTNAIVPSTKKVGAPSTALDVPLTHVNASYVRSHFDAIEARVSDAPRANEIVVMVAVTASGRPLPRIGGLQVGEIKGEDGLR